MQITDKQFINVKFYMETVKKPHKLKLKKKLQYQLSFNFPAKFEIGIILFE